MGIVFLPLLWSLSVRHLSFDMDTSLDEVRTTNLRDMDAYNIQPRHTIPCGISAPKITYKPSQVFEAEAGQPGTNSFHNRDVIILPIAMGWSLIS